jgi:hypothetical protein
VLLILLVVRAAITSVMLMAQVAPQIRGLAARVNLTVVRTEVAMADQALLLLKFQALILIYI